MKQLTKEDFRIVQQSENTFYLEQRKITFPDPREPNDAHQNWDRIVETGFVGQYKFQEAKVFKSRQEAKDFALELINKSIYPKYHKL